MNRYVIVFTIMTVLYLPPSFTAVCHCSLKSPFFATEANCRVATQQALFGTPLFEAEEQAETVSRFKISTIIVCVITYTLAFLLIWLAEKWDIAGSLYGEARSLWSGTWDRFRGRSVVGSGSGSAEKLQVSSDDTSRRMSV